MTILDRMMYDIMYRVSQPRWDDNNIPTQVAELAAQTDKTKRALDLGCGTGTHSIYLAQQGFSVIGVDISPIAIRRAHQKAAQLTYKPEFFVHDVTRLDFLAGAFDIALDVGCLHGLHPAGQQRYAVELTRLMKPGGLFLLWGMNDRPLSLGAFSPEIVSATFEAGFKLERFDPSQLHGRSSSWFWLRRR